MTLPPTLALSVWTAPFSLSTDASEIGTGAVLTQCIEEVERVIAYGSIMWARGNTKMSATDHAVMAVICAVNKKKFPSLRAAVHGHHELFGVALALQHPNSHTELPPLGSEVS